MPHRQSRGVIERNFSEEQSLEGIAEACGATSLAQIARRHDPDAILRRVARVEGADVMNPAKRPDGAMDLETTKPRTETRGSFMVVGLARRQSLSTTAAIPDQWRTFMKDFYEDIADKTDPIPVGVTTEMDADGNFQYLCGVEVSKVADLPDGLIAQTIPEQTYAVFTHTAHISALGKTYAAIWDRWLPESGQDANEGPWLERPLPTFKPRTGMGGIEIWIPIEAK